MAAKKNIKNLDLAAGFFSQPVVEQKETIKAETPKKESSTTKAALKEKPQKNEPEPTKSVGGRPKKIGLKNEQFTLTMNPEMYEKLRIVANEHTRGNFSGLIDEAIKSFCRENNINLADIEVDSNVLDLYREKQEKKSKKK